MIARHYTMDGIDGHGPPAFRSGLLGTLAAACIDNPSDMWNGVARAARSIARASAAGITLGRAARSVGSATDGRDDAATPPAIVVDRLRDAPDAIARADTGYANYAATAIGGDASIGMVWVKREDAPFTWRETVNLRELASLATLLEMLDREREQAELLIKEYQHRCSNDIQLVSSMLALRAEATNSPAMRRTLHETIDRLLALAAARASHHTNLVEALDRLCRVLNGQLGERGIVIDMVVERAVDAIDQRRSRLALIAANELVTNAIKHAFDGRGGRISIVVGGTQTLLRIAVSDDGQAPRRAPARAFGGTGIGLMTRILAGVRGELRLPQDGGKTFEINIPLQQK